MKIERVVVVLMAITVVLQAATLYRQRGVANSTPPPQQAQTPPIADAPKGATLDISGLPSEGKEDANIVLVEFSDYECPFCARYATGVGEEVKQKFVNTGKVRHVFVNNPLPMHSDAKLLATGAICAGEQGRYWTMHDKLFSQKPRSEEDIVSVASSLKVDISQFRDCLKKGDSAADRISRDLDKARSLSLSATPAFAVGHRDGDNRVVVTKLIKGAQPMEVFDSTLREALAAPLIPHAD